jgi:hypothetical protein
MEFASVFSGGWHKLATVPSGLIALLAPGNFQRKRFVGLNKRVDLGRIGNNGVSPVK